VKQQIALQADSGIRIAVEISQLCIKKAMEAKHSLHFERFSLGITLNI
jgi:hypothetical protein